MLRAGRVAGAGEDHVVHAGGAHALVRGLAHDPAQRLDEVRLAAAVRPDDAGEPRLDQKSVGSTKDLKPTRRRRVSFTGVICSLSRCGRGRGRGGGIERRRRLPPPVRLRRGSTSPASERGAGLDPEHRLEDLLELVNRQVPTAALAVDEEGRGRVDLELLLGAFPHGVHSVIKLLILQAALEFFLGKPGLPHHLLQRVEGLLAERPGCSAGRRAGR